MNTSDNTQNKKFSWVTLTTMIVSAFLPIFHPLLRYVKYLLPAVLGVYSLQKSNPVSPAGAAAIHYLKKYVWLYAGIIFISFEVSLMGNNSMNRFIANAVFILTPLLTALFCFKYYNGSHLSVMKKLFWVAVVVYIISYNSVLTNITAFFSKQFFVYAFLHSEFSGESTLAFTFGLFYLYFFINKDKKYMLLSILFSLLGFKRIVLGALIILTVTYPLIKKFYFTFKKRPILVSASAVGVNLFLMFLIYNTIQGNYDQLIQEISGLSVNHFTQGRQALYDIVFTKYGAISWLGEGIGNLDILIENHFGLVINPHSDLLKNYFEFGIILFCIWIFCLYFFNLFCYEMLTLVIYMNILFLTDNVFIYFKDLLLFYLIAGILYSKTISKKSEPAE